jgi:hypothetical protein
VRQLLARPEHDDLIQLLAIANVDEVARLRLLRAIRDAWRDRERNELRTARAPWLPGRYAYNRSMTGTDLVTLRRLAEDGNEEAADRLAVLAAERGDIDELNHLVDAGNEEAADGLARLAAGRGDIDTLKRLVDEGSEVAATLLSQIISETE